MTHAEPVIAPKRVAYLWGAGATQAEISYLGGTTINLLMRDSDLGQGVAGRIIEKLPKKARDAFFTDKGLDIEKLISLLGTCNVAEYSNLAEDMRKYYFEDIRDNLVTAKVLSDPKLAVGLLRLHANPQFKQIEELTGIISTNHDGLLQVASQKVYHSVDIGFPYESTDFAQMKTERIPVFQLHGSFTWRFGLPIQASFLTAGSAYSPDTVWIPPTIAKDSKAYPFNKLSGQAYELLAKNCDVLRVVGSALTQNDWNVLSMIFNAQRHNDLTRGASFRIELIMPHDAGIGIQDECSFLKYLSPIGFLTDGDLAIYKEAYADDTIPLTDEMKNPLFYWMKQKIKHHLANGDLTASDLDPDTAAIAGNP